MTDTASNIGESKRGYSSIIPSKITILYPLIFSFVLFFIYQPLFVVDFAFHNDYNINISGDFGWHPETELVFSLARPLNAMLLNLFYNSINSLDDLAYTRILIFCSTLILGYTLYFYLLKNLIKSEFLRISLITVIFTLPAHQLNILWANQIIPNIATIALSIGSYILFNKTERADITPKNYFLFLYSALVLFILSLLIYPPCSMFFLCLTLAKLLFFSDWKEGRKSAIREVGFCVAGMGIYFIFIKFTYIPFIKPLFDSTITGFVPQKDFELTVDLQSKWKQIKELTSMSVGEWEIPFWSDILIFFFIFLFALLCFNFAKQFFFDPGQTPKKRFILLGKLSQIFVFSVIILLIILSPVVAPSGYNVGYRLLLPYSTGLVLVIFGILNLSIKYKIIKGIVLLLTLGSCLYTQSNIFNSTMNAKIELDYVWQKLTHSDLKKFKNIIFIRPTDSEVLIDKTLLYEFRQMALNYTPIWGIQKIIMKDSGLAEFLRPPPSFLGLFDQDIFASPYIDHSSTLIIDMNEAIVHNKETSPKKSYKPWMQTSFPPGVFGPERAFDNSSSPISFWENGGGFPHWMQVFFPNTKSIEGYSLEVGEEVFRMPIEWNIQGSNDGKNWTILDQQLDQTNWKPGEKRSFVLDSKASYRGYQFIFTKGTTTYDPILRIYEIRFDP